MKHQTIYVITVFALGIAFLSGICLRLPRESRLYFANVDALSSVESGGKECSRILIEDPSDMVVYCGTCSEQPGRGKKKSVCYSW